MVRRQSPLGTLGEIFERDLGLALPYHQMHNDQAFEDDCPRRVAKAVLQGAKDLGHAGLARMRRDENVFDIFGLGCGKLCIRISRPPAIWSQCEGSTGTKEPPDAP